MHRNNIILFQTSEDGKVGSSVFFSAKPSASIAFNVGYKTIKSNENFDVHDSQCLHPK